MMENKNNIQLSEAAFGDLKGIVQDEFDEKMEDSAIEKMGIEVLAFFALLAKGEGRPLPAQTPDHSRSEKTIASPVNSMIHSVSMGKETLNERQVQALRHLRNAIVHEGYSPSVRDLAAALGYKSPRTAFLVLQSLIEGGWIDRKADGGLLIKKEVPDRKDHARTVQVPLVGSVACGGPLFAEEQIEAYIPVSTSLAKPGGKYFFLRATGDSMNKAGIDDGDLVLVRQQANAENGQKVVALIDDKATVKEFHHHGDTVALMPKSTNKKHQPIILTEDFLIQGVVVATIPQPK